MPVKSQPSLLYLTPDKIRLLVPTDQAFDTYEIQREDKDLSPVLAKIQQDLELKSVQVVLSPQLIEIVNLIKVDKSDPDHILLQTADQVDFDITSESIAFNVQDDFIHVVAMPLKLLENLSQAAFANQLHITGIFSMADALATLSADQQSPFLLAWAGLEDTRGIVQLVYQKLAFSPKTFARLTSKKLTDLMGLCIDSFNVRPKLLYHSLPDKLPDLPKTLSEQAMELKPLAYLVKNPLDTNHPLVPAITPLDIEEKKGSPVTKSPLNTIILAVIIGVIVIAGIFVGGLLVSNRSIPLFNTQPTPTPTAAPPTPTATPTPLDLTQFNLQVLNGTGTPGQAGQVQEVLEEAGFEEVATDNANRYTYQQTQIQLHPQAPPPLLDKIKEILQDSFPATAASQLDKTSDYDAVVITGQ